MTIKQALTIENCTEYLQGEYFTDIQFTREENGILYFVATDDEDGQRKEIHFDPNYNNVYQVCVCILDNVSREWHIYELLNE